MGEMNTSFTNKAKYSRCYYFSRPALILQENVTLWHIFYHVQTIIIINNDSPEQCRKNSWCVQVKCNFEPLQILTFVTRHKIAVCRERL